MRKTDYTGYWLALALVCVLALVYIEWHDLGDRYETYQDTVQTVSEQRQDVKALESAVEDARNRLQDMDSDPLEQEATIRRVRGLVREGEIVYRVETPD